MCAGFSLSSILSLSDNLFSKALLLGETSTDFVFLAFFDQKATFVYENKVSKQQAINRR